MNIQDIVGKRVKYTKEGSRHGWKGVVEAIREERTMPGGYRVVIQYDNGTLQDYSAEAIQGFGVPRVFENCAGYIEIQPDEPEFVTHKVIVLCSQTQKIVCFVNNVEQAYREAERLAKASNYTYIVYGAVCKFEKSEPPVTRTDIV